MLKRTPPKTSNAQTTKRKHHETSPEDTNSTAVSNPIGNVDVNELMKMMQVSLEAVMQDKLKNVEVKLENVATKSDIEDIKQHITDIDGKFETLKQENVALRDEIAQLREERCKDHQQIKRLVEQGKRKNVIFRGISKKGSPRTSVEHVCNNVMKVNGVQVAAARVLFTKDDKICVVAEMQTEQMATNIFKNLKSLAGSTIKVEKDLSEDRQQDRKVLMQLKFNILAVDKTHKVFVKNDSIKVGTHWMSWNRNKELMCGKERAETVLSNLYGEKINSVSYDYNILLEKLNQKN